MPRAAAQWFGGLAVMWALMLLSYDLSSVAAQPQAAVVPALPAWAAQIQKFNGARNTSFSYNRKVVAEANASDTVFDVVFYGDSLTGLLVQIEDNEAVFNTFFNSATTPWKTARLGVGGSTVEELTWRILVNGEKLAQDPLVVVLLVGINNALETQPWLKLDWLLGWMAAAMPHSKVLVVAPLPAVRQRSATLLKEYRPVAQRHRVQFSTCGMSLNPSNVTLYTDGVHLTPSGYTAVFTCLKPQLVVLRRSAAEQRRAALQRRNGVTRPS